MTPPRWHAAGVSNSVTVAAISTLTRISLAVALAGAWACKASPTGNDGADSVPPPATAHDTAVAAHSGDDTAVAPHAGDDAAARTCASDDDCDGGICEGEGCGDVLGTCVARDRMCTRDAQLYCGCDGVEFRASGRCPNRRYAHRGPCTTAP